MMAGVNFKKCIIHPDAYTAKTPVTTDPNWEDGIFKPRKYCKSIKLDLTQVPVLDDYTFWYFGLHDKNTVEIYRNDIKDVAHLKNRETVVCIDIMTDRDPATWTLWPYSKSKGWLEKITQPI
jgi:hypothetical protein